MANICPAVKCVLGQSAVHVFVIGGKFCARNKVGEL